MGGGVEVGSACKIGFGVVLSFPVCEVGGGGEGAAGLEGSGGDDIRMRG